MQRPGGKALSAKLMWWTAISSVIVYLAAGFYYTFTNKEHLYFLGREANRSDAWYLAAGVFFFVTVLFSGGALWAYFLHHPWTGKKEFGPAAPEKLKTSGPYAFLRHPIYAFILAATFSLSTFIQIACGTVLGLPAYGGSLLMFVLFNALARSEEEELLNKFGPEYREYMRKTHRWLPGSIRGKSRTDRDGGPLKDIGDGGIEQVPTGLLEMWKDMATDTLFRYEQEVIKNELVFAKVLETENMPDGMTAYHFSDRQDNGLVIVLKKGLHPLVRQEAVFHESREDFWESHLKAGVGLTEEVRIMAHRLAAAEEVRAFFEGELTPYHKEQLVKMSSDIEKLDAFLEEERDMHYGLIEEHLGKPAREDIEAYEKLFREFVRQVRSEVRGASRVKDAGKRKSAKRKARSTGSRLESIDRSLEDRGLSEEKRKKYLYEVYSLIRGVAVKKKRTEDETDLLEKGIFVLGKQALEYPLLRKLIFKYLLKLPDRMVEKNIPISLVKKWRRKLPLHRAEKSRRRIGPMGENGEWSYAEGASKKRKKLSGKGRGDIKQIGKRARVVGIEHSAKDIVRAEVEIESKEKGRIESVILEHQGKFDAKMFVDRLNEEEGIDAFYREMILDFLSLLENSPPEFYTYDTLVEDLFGFACADHGLIAIHSSLADDPVALFHEVCEYLVRDNRLRFRSRFREKELVVSLNGEEKGIPLSGQTLKFLKKEKWREGWDKDTHYLLRLLQKEVFAAKDAKLTSGMRMDRTRKLLAERFDLDINSPKEKKRLDAVALKIAKNIGKSLPVAEKVMDHLEEGMGLDLKALNFGTKSKLMTIVYGISVSREGAFEFWKGFLEKARERFGMGPWREMKPVQVQKIATAAYYVARGGKKKEDRFNEIIGETEKIFGIKVKELGLGEKIRVMTAAYNVALHDGLETYKETISYTEEEFGIKVKELELGEKIRVMTAAYEVALQDGLNVYKEEFSKRATVIPAMGLAQKLTLMSEIYHMVLPPKQIGKRARVLGIEHSAKGIVRAEVEIESKEKAKRKKVQGTTDDGPRTTYIELDHKGKFDAKMFVDRLNEVEGIDAFYREMILDFLSLLENSPPEFYTYDTLIEDLFGFACADHGLIAIHSSLADDPVALFHEVCEYLFSAGLVIPRLKSDRLILEMNSGYTYTVEADEALHGLLEDGEQWTRVMDMVLSKRENWHYLLRILQREVFGEADRDLTAAVRGVPVALELGKDLEINRDRLERLAVFMDRYMELIETSVGARQEEYIGQCRDPKRIADLFYLKEVYGFDLFALLETGETFWSRETEEGTVTYSFEMDEDNTITVYEEHPEDGEFYEVAKATDASYGIKDRRRFSGRNLGNFVIKVNQLTSWAIRGKRESRVLIAYDPAGGLREYYRTIGENVVHDMFENEWFAFSELYGGLDAGIFVPGQYERLRRTCLKGGKRTHKGLSAYVWRVWSQREMDRYFRLTRDIESSDLIDALEAFSDGHIWPEASRGATPEEVGMFVKKHIEGKRGSGQIGKRARVSEIIEADGRVKAKVDIFEKGGQAVSASGYIGLERRGAINLDELMVRIENSDAMSQGDKETAVLMLSSFRFMDPHPVLYTFSEDDLIEDLAGFSLKFSGENMIALQEGLEDDPVALFHELCEAAVNEGSMDISVSGDTATVKLEPIKESVQITLSENTLDSMKREEWWDEEAAAVVPQTGEMKAHYHIRVLEREIFGEMDLAFTRKIRAYRLIREIAGYLGPRSGKDIPGLYEHGGNAGERLALASGELARIIKNAGRDRLYFDKASSAAARVVKLRPDVFRDILLPAVLDIFRTKDLPAMVYEKALKLLMDYAEKEAGGAKKILAVMEDALKAEDPGFWQLAYASAYISKAAERGDEKISEKTVRALGQALDLQKEGMYHFGYICASMESVAGSSRYLAGKVLGEYERVLADEGHNATASVLSSLASMMYRRVNGLFSASTVRALGRTALSRHRSVSSMALSIIWRTAHDREDLREEVRAVLRSVLEKWYPGKEKERLDEMSRVLSGAPSEAAYLFQKAAREEEGKYLFDLENLLLRISDMYGPCGIDEAAAVFSAGPDEVKHYFWLIERVESRPGYDHGDWENLAARSEEANTAVSAITRSADSVLNENLSAMDESAFYGYLKNRRFDRRSIMPIGDRRDLIKRWMLLKLMSDSDYALEEVRRFTALSAGMEIDLIEILLEIGVRDLCRDYSFPRSGITSRLRGMREYDLCTLQSRIGGLLAKEARKDPAPVLVGLEDVIRAGKDHLANVYNRQRQAVRWHDFLAGLVLEMNAAAPEVISLLALNDTLRPFLLKLSGDELSDDNREKKNLRYVNAVFNEVAAAKKNIRADEVIDLSGKGGRRIELKRYGDDYSIISDGNIAGMVEARYGENGDLRYRLDFAPGVGGILGLFRKIPFYFLEQLEEGKNLMTLTYARPGDILFFFDMNRKGRLAAIEARFSGEEEWFAVTREEALKLCGYEKKEGVGEGRNFYIRGAKTMTRIEPRKSSLARLLEFSGQPEADISDHMSYRPLLERWCSPWILSRIDPMARTLSASPEKFAGEIEALLAAGTDEERESAGRELVAALACSPQMTSPLSVAEMVKTIRENGLEAVDGLWAIERFERREDFIPGDWEKVKEAGGLCAEFVLDMRKEKEDIIRDAFVAMDHGDFQRFLSNHDFRKGSFLGFEDKRSVIRRWMLEKLINKGRSSFDDIEGFMNFSGDTEVDAIGILLEIGANDLCRSYGFKGKTVERLESFSESALCGMQSEIGLLLSGEAKKDPDDIVVRLIDIVTGGFYHLKGVTNSGRQIERWHDFVAGLLVQMAISTPEVLKIAAVHDSVEPFLSGLVESSPNYGKQLGAMLEGEGSLAPDERIDISADSGGEVILERFGDIYILKYRDMPVARLETLINDKGDLVYSFDVRPGPDREKFIVLSLFRRTLAYFARNTREGSYFETMLPAREKDAFFFFRMRAKGLFSAVQVREEGEKEWIKADRRKIHGMISAEGRKIYIRARRIRDRHAEKDEERRERISSLKDTNREAVPLLVNALVAAGNSGKKTVLAVDESIGEGCINELIRQVVNSFPRLEDNNEDLKRFLNNVEFIKGEGAALARRLCNITDGQKGKVLPEDLIILTTRENMDDFGRFRGAATITGIDDSLLGGTSYIPVTQVLLFALAKHLGWDPETLKKYYTGIVSAADPETLRPEEIEALFGDRKTFVIRLIPDAVEFDEEELREIIEAERVMLARA
ncbi:MAG: hypothetical protein GF408_04855 [Candidatus Omnitrophica bacterium]|nr:hypothetical protein [Candidatus Omnitrophota bacterium]